MTVDLIKKLYYEEGLSTQEVARRLKKSVWQVISFMRKHKLKRRSQAETHRLQFARSPLSFKKKDNLSQKDRELWISGLSLYWAEGVKFKGSQMVDLANSDLGIVLLFLTVLRTIYHVNEKRLRVLLYSYANQNQQALIDYWSRVLSVPVSQFIKPYIRKDYREDKKDRMPNGLVHIRYSDVRLFGQIMSDIDIIRTQLLG